MPINECGVLKMDYLLIAVMWIAYCLLHSFLISTGFTNLLTRLLKNYYAFYRIFFVTISLALLIPLIRYTDQLDSNIIITYSPFLNNLRYILILGSLSMFFWAFFFDYDSLSFFGIRQILNFGKAKKINPPEDLKRNGLLGVVRHPMYFALIVYLWCQTFTVTGIIVNIVLTFYIIMGTIIEEKKLVLEFGDTYLKYQREVPMLIPFTKRKVK
jgi:protein-S-isoprenylcysteine O-methyltransferase Ste14